MLNEIYDLFGHNKTWFVAINTITNSSIIPHILQIISNVFIIWNFAVFYLLTCIVLFLKLKNMNHNREELFYDWYYKMFKIGIIYAFLGLSYAAMKFSFNLPRPYCSLAPTDFITIANTESKRCLSSFPSAHAAMSVIITYFLWSYIGRVGKILMILLVVTVGISRITLAMHYPSDVLFSYLIAIFVIIIGNFSFNLFKNNLIKDTGLYIYKFLFK